MKNAYLDELFEIWIFYFLSTGLQNAKKSL